MLELATVSLLNGVVYGLLLFMLTSGLTLIFSMMGVLNFAHASVFMLGAYLSYQFGRWVGFWPALVIAPLLCGLIGAAIERYGLRHVHKSGHVAEILFTFGLAYLIEELVTMIWGRNTVANSVPASIDFPLPPEPTRARRAGAVSAIICSSVASSRARPLIPRGRGGNVKVRVTDPL